jgi:hypothetical protein
MSAEDFAALISGNMETAHFEQEETVMPAQVEPKEKKEPI